MKTSEYNISSYLSGYYQVFAFDVNSSGAINPSNGSKVYTAFYSSKMNFTDPKMQMSKLDSKYYKFLIHDKKFNRVYL